MGEVMQPKTTILVTDSRWPLDADALSVVREVERQGSVTLQRVPDGLEAFRFTSGAREIIIGGLPPAPPSGWTGTVCWHEAKGCEALYVDAAVFPGTMSVSAFLEETAPTEPSAPWVARTAELLVLALVLVVVRRRILLVRRRSRTASHLLPTNGVE